MEGFHWSGIHFFGERGAELSGAFWCDFERGAEIVTAQLRSHALIQIYLLRDIGFRKIV